MDFRKEYTKHIKETTFALAVGGDIDQENPVNPDNAKEIQDILRKKGVRAEVTPSEKRYNEVWIKTSFSRAYIRKILDKEGITESLVAEATWEYVYELESDHSEDGGPHEFDGEVNAYSEREATRKVEKLANTNRNRINKRLERSRKPGLLKVQDLTVVKESLVEGFVPLVPLNMRYMNKKKAQDAIDKVSDNQGNIRFVKHFQNDTVGLVKFIYGDKEVKNFEFQFPGIFYKNKRVTFHDLILKAREKVDGAKKILGLGKYKKEEKELEEKYFSQSNIAKAIHIAKNSSGNYDGSIYYIEKKISKGLSDHPKVKEALFKANEEKEMKEAFPKPKEDKDKKIKDLENKVQKLEVEKESELNPEPNPDTGEIPLQVGIAYKYIRDKARGIVDKEEKKKEKKEVKVGKKTLTNKRKEKIDVEPEMEVM